MKLKLFSLLTIIIMVTSINISAFATETDDSGTTSMLDGSYTEVIPDTNYVYSLSSSGSGRYDEFYITTSGASEISVKITPNFRNPYESTDDFDLYYRAGSQVSGCSTTTCSTYDSVSWKAEAFKNGFEAITITNPANTVHHFRVQRYSGYGTEYYNFIVSVTSGSAGDNISPTVTINSPTNGVTVSNTVTVTATASDNVGVDNVAFSVDGSLKFTDYTSPYEFSWDTTLYTDASHSITATAYDAAGNSASDTNSYTVSNPTTPPSGTCGETPRVTGGMPFWNDAIDVEKAHASGCYGGDTVVVILDTGLNDATYPNLFPAGSINTQYSKSYTKSGGFDNIDWNKDVTAGHGTSVASTILGYYAPTSWGITGNYVQGVAPNAEIVMFRVVYWVGSGVTYDQMVNNWATAINDAVALHNGALSGKNMVISMSLGYDESLASASANTNIMNAIANARANGIPVSTSAGNDGPSPNTTGYPANIDASTSVAAAGWSGYTGSYGVAGITGDIPENDFTGLTIADFSSRGKIEITGMGWQLALPTWDGSISYISGTSFSCPQISGVYALMFSMYGSQTVNYLESTMMNSAYYAGTSTTWGVGFVQVDAALGI